MSAQDTIERTGGTKFQGKPMTLVGPQIAAGDKAPDFQLATKDLSTATLETVLDGGKRAALVDPAGLPENLLRILRDGSYHLQYILITHKHKDHCDATAEVAAAFPQARIVMHPLDAPAIGILAESVIPVRDGDEIPFGDDVNTDVIAPGGMQSDGSSCYLFKSTIFTGDSLFAASVGGAYGDVSTYGDILNSVRSKLFTLPDVTAVMPGHGPPTTIELEKAHNPFFP